MGDVLKIKEMNDSAVVINLFYDPYDTLAYILYYSDIGFGNFTTSLSR